MARFVKPRVHLVGCSAIDRRGLEDYLRETGNQEFMKDVRAAEESGLSDGEILCSFYAKLCYKSLTLGQNDNLTRTRNIPDNVEAAFSAGHGSVFEHAWINFVVADCSRVFTHELVRHRVGTAFSQTSGRYVRSDRIDFVTDPILEPVQAHLEMFLGTVERMYNELVRVSGVNEMKDFDAKKKMTSALRRILPNGQANEIGFSVNLRALRHVVQMRTSRFAEWEIREVFSQVYRLVKERFSLVFHGAREEYFDGIVEVSGMKMNPY